MGGSSIGTVSINDGSDSYRTMLKLDGRGLVKFHQPLIPFLTYGVNYWSLSPSGWEMLDELKKEEKKPKKVSKKKK